MLSTVDNPNLAAVVGITRRPVKPLKHPLQLLRRQSNTFIPNLDARTAAGHRGTQVHRAARR